MKAKQLRQTAKESQLIELREHEIREAANWIGVPPHKLGDTTRTSHNSLEQENQDYLDGGLDPWFVTWEEECEDKLLTEEQKQRDTHVIEFLRQALVRADLKARGEYYSKALGGVPWMVPDEPRGLENLPPLPDGEGAVFRVPVNIEDVDDEEEDEPDAPPALPPPPPPDEDDEDEDDEEEDRMAAIRQAHRDLLADRVGFAVRRVTADAKRAAKNPRTFCAWLDKQMETKHATVVRDTLGSAFRVIEADGADPVAGRSAEFATTLFKVLHGRFNAVAERAQGHELPDGIAAEAERLCSGFPAEFVNDPQWS
jgi:hypothetical protein